MPKILICIIALLFFASCNKSKDPQQIKSETQALAPAMEPEQIAALLEKPGEALLLGLNNLKLKVDDPPQLYKDFFQSCGIKESYLNRESFSKTDLHYIAQTVVMHKAAKSAIAGNSEDAHMAALFEFVEKKMKSDPKGQQYQDYPLGILQKGYGPADRQVWLFSELAYQIGADSYVIFLHDPVTDVPIHAIGEVTYKGKNYIVDPMYDKFIAGRTLTGLSTDEIADIWSDFPQLQKAFQATRIYSPSMPQAYCPRFTALGKYLEGVTSYRIGEDPKVRAKRRGMIKGEKLEFWDYPVRLLHNFQLNDESR